MVGELPILVACDEMASQPRFTENLVAELIADRMIGGFERSCDEQDPGTTPDGWRRRLSIFSIHFDSTTAIVRASIAVARCTRVDEVVHLRGPSPWRVVEMTLTRVSSGHCAVISKPPGK